MNPFTATPEAATDATTTTDKIVTLPTGASPDSYAEKNAPSYDGIEMKASPGNGAEKDASADNDADKNASTAPLLSTYSTTMGPPPPRAWRRMTGGLTARRNSEKAADIANHPRVRSVYARKGWFLMIQWFFTFWVLGVTAQSLSLSEKLPFVVPMLAYIVACAAVHVVPMYYFTKEVNPISPTNPRPARWYLISYAISSLAWAGAVVCVVLVLIKSMPFGGEEESELQRCRHGRKCHPATHNAQVNTLAKMNMATTGFIILSIIGHWYQLSKLWLCTFTADEIRVAYEFARGG